MHFTAKMTRLSLLAGAEQARGISVVIDVLRAFTSAAFMSYYGARSIVLVADADAPLSWKERAGYLAVGEIDGKKPPGYDLGNSPSEIMSVGSDLFQGRTVAQRTTAGTRGAVAAARHADAVILGSYVTSSAIARYIRSLSPSPAIISLVAMGDDGLQITPDDESCADYIEHLLTGREYNHVEALAQIMRHDCTQRFLRGDRTRFPPEDPVLSLQPDLFDFALVATLEDETLVARRIDVP
jgi:2-phosphosulfolactate phosphatase